MWKGDQDGEKPAEDLLFDSTGMFHWCHEQAMASCVIVSHTCDALHFNMGSLKNQHFQSIVLAGREEGHKKSTLCSLLIMSAILDDPYVVLI